MTEPTQTAGWTISGTGESKPSLTFRVERDAQLNSEKNDNLKPGIAKWTNKDSVGGNTNPQPKYQYIFNVTYKTWDDMWSAVEVSTGWKIGEGCRKGDYVSNALKDADDNITLKPGHKAYELVLPADRKVVVKREMTAEEMMDEVIDKHSKGLLTGDEYVGLGAKGLTKVILDMMVTARDTA